MSKPKPKFRVGQVVCDKTTGSYRRVYSFQQITSTFWYGLFRRDGVDFCIDQSTLRPLNRRERGQS